MPVSGVRIEGIERVNKVITALLRKTKDLHIPMKKAALVMHRSVMMNFRVEGRPKWKSLKEATIKARRGTGLDKILQDRGWLRDSIAFESDKKSATVGTTQPYAAIHHFGSKAKYPRMNIDARPYMLLQSGDIDIIEKVFAKEYERTVRKYVG